MKTTRLTLALVLIAASLIVISPVQAINSDWTVESMGAGAPADSVREIALDHDGERLGMAYRYSSTNGIGFSLRTAAGVWTQQNALAVAAATNLVSIHLLNEGSGKWLIVGIPTGVAQINSYTSTNDGVTWTTHTSILSGAAVGGFDVANISPTKVGFALCDNTHVKYGGSLDGGASLAYTFNVDDNVGNPASSSGTFATCQGSVALTGDNTGQAHIIFNGQTPPCPGSLACSFSVHSNSGSDQFWTVPYYSGGACPTGCSSVDGSTSLLVYLRSHKSIVGYDEAFPQNGDLLAFVRDEACATTPNTLAYSATYQGQDNSETAGGTCNSYNIGSFQPIAAAGCSAYEVTGLPGTGYDRIAGNSAHNFIAALGHTTLCSGVGFEISLKTGLSGTWANTFTDPSQTKVFDVDMTASKSYAAFVDSTAGGAVKVISAASPTSVGVTASVAVTNLRGFDVDDSGGVVIARVSGGSTVQVFNAQSLAAGATATDADCSGKLDGVAAYASSTDIYTTYFECSNSGSHPANSMKIRSGTLGDPVVPTTCAGFNGGDPGDITTTLSNSINVPDTLHEISSLGMFPIDFSDCQSSSTSTNHVLLSWAFSTTNGQVGVWAVVEQEGSDSTISNTAFITYDGAGATEPLQICEWTDTSNADHVGAVGLGGSKFYVPTADAHSTLGAWHPDANIVLNYTLGGTYALADALSCAGYRAIIATGTSIAILCTNAGHCPSGVAVGQPVWTPKVPAGGDVVRGAVLSEGGQYAAYIDDGGIHILNATSGNELLAVAEPETGSFWDMRMDRSGSSLWLAYTDHIYRYDISAVTCGLNCTNTEIPPPVPTTSSSGTLTGDIGTSASRLGGIFGGGETGGALMLAIIYILLFAAGCYFIFNESIFGGIIGAVLGFAFSIFSGLVPPVITFLIVAIMIGLGVMRFWTGRNDGGM